MAAPSTLYYYITILYNIYIVPNRFMFKMAL